MTIDEIRQVIADKCPVILNIPLLGDMEYKQVLGVIEKQSCVSAELLDRNGHSITVARIERVRLA